MSLARWRRTFAVLIVAVSTIGVYGQIYGHGFLRWDDNHHVSGNPLLNPPSWAHVATFWKQPYFGLYIPVSYTFFSAEAYLAAPPPVLEGPQVLNPHVFHVGSILLHLANSLLVLVILSRLVGARWAACAGAALFCVHPVQAEPVAWISDTRGLLAGFFSLVAIWQYLRFAEHRGEEGRGVAEPTGRRVKLRRASGYVLSSAAYALALLSKPSAAALPLIVLMIDFGLLRNQLRRCVTAVTPWILGAVAVALSAQSEQHDAIKYIAPLWARPFVAADALTFYLRKLIVPLGLAPDYGRTPEAVLGWVQTYVIWLVPLAVAAVLAWRKDRIWLVAAGLVVAPLLPVLGLVPFAYQDISTVADRYLYLAMLGPALALTTWLSRSPTRRRWIAATAVCALYAAVCFQQVGYWRDDETLFTRGLDIHPDSWVAHTNLANAIADDQRFDEALEHYKKVLELLPDHSKTYNNIGFALILQGNYDEALGYLQRALELEPDYSDALKNLAFVFDRQEKVDDAIAAYYAALRVRPDLDEPHNNLGNICSEKGDHARALWHYRQALRINPRFGEAYNNLANLQSRMGDHQAALENLLIAVRVRPDLPRLWANLGSVQSKLSRRPEAAAAFRKALELNPDIHGAAKELAWILATAADAELRNGPDAVRLAEQARRNIPTDDPSVLDTLAAAYAEVGQFDQALELAREAHRQALQIGRRTLARDLEKRVALYQEQRPYREHDDG